MWTCIYWLGGSWLMRMPWKWSWISIIKDKENIAIQRRTISAPEHDRPQPNAPSHQFLWEYSIIVQRGRFWSLTIAGKKDAALTSLVIFTRMIKALVSVSRWNDYAFATQVYWPGSGGAASVSPHVTAESDAMAPVMSQCIHIDRIS